MTTKQRIGLGGVLLIAMPLLLVGTDFGVVERAIIMFFSGAGIALLVQES